jgi:hypothetical protein
MSCWGNQNFDFLQSSNALAYRMMKWMVLDEMADFCPFHHGNSESFLLTPSMISANIY